MGKKYYAVKQGKAPGIYASWNECKLQVHGFPGAIYKSFLTKEEAESFVGTIHSRSSEGSGTSLADEEVIAYVDGSYSKEQKRYSYGCAILWNSEQFELSGASADERFVTMNNVAGEVLGSIKAICWAIEKEAKSIRVYHDYEGISRWANEEWRANKEGTKMYQEFIRESRKKIEIQFTKVAAHTGVELNERADQLAKGALSL